nr:MAG TPA: hypothetical protein [Caudoviricetes sp.]
MSTSHCGSSPFTNSFPKYIPPEIYFISFSYSRYGCGTVTKNQISYVKHRAVGWQ